MMDMDSLEYGIVNYSTPFYVFDTDELTKRVKQFREITHKRADLCFAMKANPFLVGPMAAMTDRIEVCSMGEFRICQEAQIPVQKLVISGVLKKKEDFWQILNTCGGGCLCSIESLSQMEQAAEWARKNRRKVSVLLRLTSGNQFGMDKDLVQNLMQARELFSHVNIRGIHYFSGTRKKIEKICRELEQLDAFLLEAEEKTGCKAEELEYGPGLFAACFEGEEDRAAQELAAICEKISAMRWKGKVTLEMGRAFTASCGYYLTGVRDIKKNNGVNYCIVDGGIHQLQYDGQIRGMFRPGIRISPEHENEPARKWTVCGSLCTANDILIQNVTLQGLRQGNVLIFENAGAYSAMEGMALFLSHELPKIALYSQAEGWKLIRGEKPTYEWNMAKEVGNENFDKYFNGH